MPKASVIIPVCNQAQLTLQCLRAVCSADDCEVVVVDDASVDYTARVLESFAPRVQTIRHRENQGFARSCNDGAAASVGEYLVFLNNDTIPQPGWINALIYYAETHPRAAAVGARLLYPDDSIQHAGVTICQDRFPRHIYSGFPANHAAVCKSRQFQIVTAACVLLRREAFAEAGGFDEAFRNGFEDVDLCLRLRERRWEIHYCAESVCYHLESVSPGRFKHDGENVRLYRQRWLNKVEPDDLRYYADDGLLQLCYEGAGPPALKVDPLLATFENGRASRVEQALRNRNRDLREARRENTRLLMELGGSRLQSPELQYREFRTRFRSTIEKLVPRGATVLIVSKGDSALLDLPGRRGWHFPQNDRGVYAGHHPADSAEAASQLRRLVARGAEYLVVPATSAWWHNHYSEFFQYVEAHSTALKAPKEVCLAYALHGQPTEKAGTLVNESFAL